MKVEKLLSKNLLENSVIFAILAIFLTMYGPRLHIRLPKTIRSLFSNNIFRAVILFLVVFMANRDINASLMLTIIFLIVMYGVQMSHLLEGFYVENFESYGKPVADCSNYKDDENPQPSYPLN
jgi:hypothetical protein